MKHIKHHNRGIEHAIIELAAAAVACLLALSAAGCQQFADWQKAQTAQATKEKDPADADFQSAASRPPTPQTLLALSQIVASQGRDAECAILLTRIISEHPDFFPAYCELAECRMRQQDSNAAIDTLTTGLQTWAQNPLLLNNLGMCHLLRHEYDQARDAFAAARKAAPDVVVYQTNLAVALGLAGQYEEALAAYQVALPPASAHFNLALLCKARNDLTRANQEFAAAQALDGPASPAPAPAP